VGQMVGGVVVQCLVLMMVVDIQPWRGRGARVVASPSRIEL
jgi:hypothetical protein